MFMIPFSELAKWPVPNYIDPITRSPLQHWIPNGIFLFLSTVCVSLRMYQRIWVRRYLGLDDVFILLAFTFSIGVTVIVAMGNKNLGWNMHLWDIQMDHYQPSLKALYFVRIFWGLASCFVRFSVVCLFYRLIKTCGAPRYFSWIMHVTTMMNLLIWVYYLITGIVPCIPIRAYWAWPPIQAKCINDGANMEAAGVINTFAEAWLATLPLLALSHFNISKKQRWSIVTILSLGFLVTIVGIFRTYYIWQAITTHDLTWYSGPQWICAEVELHLAVTCASAAPLRPLLTRLIRGLQRNMKWTTALNMQIGGGKSQLNTEKSHNSTSITISQIHHQADLENASEWACIMRTIDLEGIPDDGLGYTVIISGPTASRTTGRERFAAITMNLLQPRVRRPNPRRKVAGKSTRHGQHASNDQNSTLRLDIPVTVEVDVEQIDRVESNFRDCRPQLREKRLNSIGSVGTSGSENSIVNIDAALDGFEFADFSQHLANGNEPLVPLGPRRPKPDGNTWNVEQ